MVRLVFALIYLFIFSNSVFAQSWDFAEPKKLAAAINSPYEETFPLLSPDGKTLYFSRVLYPENVGGKFTGSDVWISEFDPKTNTWKKATHAKEVFNNTGNNAIVGVSSNGNILYSLNTTSNKKADGIYFSKRINNRWSKPEFIPIAGIETEGFFGVYVSPDYDVIILSMKAPDSRGEEDLYISLKNQRGEWSRPKNLGPSINTNGFEISPFLSPDKRRLYFSSNGHKGLGDADIFYSDRLYNSWDTWSAARNLGEKLNSKKFDAYFSIYGDSIAYFASNRNGNYADIYNVSVVPGNELLSFGQRYLTRDESNNIINPNVPRKISFQQADTTLDASQKELLFFIANKINEYPDINVQLLVVEENNPELTEARLTAIADHLRDSGLEMPRIVWANTDRTKKASKARTAIDLVLFK